MTWYKVVRGDGDFPGDATESNDLDQLGKIGIFVDDAPLSAPRMSRTVFLEFRDGRRQSFKRWQLEEVDIQAALDAP